MNCLEERFRVAIRETLIFNLLLTSTLCLYFAFNMVVGQIKIFMTLPPAASSPLQVKATYEYLSMSSRCTSYHRDSNQNNNDRYRGRDIEVNGLTQLCRLIFLLQSFS